MAVVAGVISTTSYRKKLKRATPRSSEPAPQRAASGSKGGQASRRAALQRSRASRQRMDVACADSISQTKRWSEHDIYSRLDGEHKEDDISLSQPHPHIASTRNIDTTYPFAPDFMSDKYSEKLFTNPAMSDDRLTPPLDPIFGSMDDESSTFVGYPLPVYGGDFSQSPISMTAGTENFCVSTGHRFSTSIQQQFGFV